MLEKYEREELEFALKLSQQIGKSKPLEEEKK
jgi:hypothetical protein